MRQFALVLLLGHFASAAAADWLQFGYDQAHSGNNPQENGFVVAAANTAQWHVGIHAFGSGTFLNSNSTPIYLSNVVTAAGPQDLLFLVASDGTLIAFTANDGSVVWSKRPTPAANAYLTTGSPAVDPNRQFVYAYGLDGYVHKYQVGDGTEITSGGWPELSTLKPSVEKGAAGIAIASPSGGINYLYHATNGYYGDYGDYQGHVTAINLSTGTQNIFNTQCSNMFVHFVENGTAGSDDCVLSSGGRMSGIWGRPGVIYDKQTNRIYFATGNGLFDANLAGHYDWGDSVLALKPDGTGSGFGQPVDSYTPSTYASLYGGDVDLGSTSPVILPSSSASYPHLALQSGKDSCVRLINLDNMSGAGAPGYVGGELNAATSCSTDSVIGGVFTQPAVWVNPADHKTWVFIATGNQLAAYRLNVSGTPTLSKQWTAPNWGTSPVIANGILYYVSGSSLLTALDALTGMQLWSASIGSIYWHSPIVVNGHLYVADNYTSLWSFALDGIFRNGFQ